VRHTRIAIVVVLLNAGLLGAYWVATAQEERTPWPPPPVKYEEGSMPLPPAPAPTAAPKPAAPPAPKAAVDKKGAAPQKLPPGVLPALAQEASGAGPGDKSPVKAADLKEGGPDLPPPIPPKLTVPDAPSPGPNPNALPPLPAIPATPGPAFPIGANATEVKVAAPAGPPKADPVPNPASGAPAPKAAQPVATPPAPSGKPPIVTMPPAELAPAAAGAQAPPADLSGGQPPAFVLIKSKKAEAKSAPAPLPDPIAPAGPPPGVPQQPAPPPAPETPAAAPVPGAALLALKTPALTVEKRGPAAGRPGEPLSFQFVVRNLGAVAATQVRVEDELPAGARVLSADPMPLVQNGRAVWVLDGLPSGTERVLALALQTTVPGELPHRTRVEVVATAATPGAAPPVAAPPGAAPASAAPSAAGAAPVPAAHVAQASPPGGLLIQVAAPTAAGVGRPAVFEVTYTNQSKQRMTGLVLHAVLSNGLRHPVGQSIEADVGDLEPGVSQTVKVNTTAVLAGRQGMQVRLTGPGGVEASSQAGADVAPASPGVVIQQPAATRVFAGRTTDLRIEVGNFTNKPMRHVAIVSHLPEEVEFIAASDSGLYQPAGGTVQWLLDALAPGQTQLVVLRVQGKKVGQGPHHVVARADGVPESKSSGALTVEGTAELRVDLRGEAALEVGKECVYEVVLANPGSSPNTNVRVEMALAPGLVPRTAQGPIPFRIDGQSVIFEGLQMLVPQGHAIYRVTAQGQSPGDRRVRVSVTSDQVRTPATQESGTRVYRD
jgi:uncharacterized repeat protein (TIGR01451 family)